VLGILAFIDILTSPYQYYCLVRRNALFYLGQPGPLLNEDLPALQGQVEWGLQPLSFSLLFCDSLSHNLMLEFLEAADEAIPFNRFMMVKDTQEEWSLIQENFPLSLNLHSVTGDFKREGAG
jgi:hypothetical protein